MYEQRLPIEEWKAKKQAELKETIAAQKSALQEVVQDGGHLFSTSGRYACGIKYDTHEGGKSMEMNSVMATEIVAAEVEHIVLPQIVSIKQASRMLGLPPYYLRRLCKEVPGVAFQSGIKWYINLGKLVDYYNNAGRITAG